MCRAAVNTHMVQATSTFHASQSELSTPSIGLLAQAYWRHASKEKIQEESREDEGNFSGRSYLDVRWKTLRWSQPCWSKTGQETLIFPFLTSLYLQGEI